MPSVDCPFDGCEYKAENDDVGVIAALLNIQAFTHKDANSTSSQQKPPKMDRPSIELHSSEELWNAFDVRWNMFKKSTKMSADETVRQLFQCCDTELGNALLKSYKAVVSGDSEYALLEAIKKLAVPPVAISARRSALLGTKQDHSENARTYLARLNGKAAICAYSIPSTCDCDIRIDFTDVIVKDVLISGLVDEEIRKEVLGWADLDEKSSEETVRFIEAKEMARDALASSSSSAAGISAYKKMDKTPTRSTKAKCKSCSKEIDAMVWSQQKHKMIERTLCYKCWRQSNQKTKKLTSEDVEAGGIIIGAAETVTIPVKKYSGKQVARKPIVLDSYIFDSAGCWKRAEAMAHPTLKLNLFTDPVDYAHIGMTCPEIRSPCTVKVVTDTGAQSCL